MATTEHVYAKLDVDTRIARDFMAYYKAHTNDRLEEVPGWIIGLTGKERSDFDSTQELATALFNNGSELGFLVAVEHGRTRVITDDNGKFFADNVCLLLHEAFKVYQVDDYACINIGYGFDSYTDDPPKDDVYGGCAYFVTKGRIGMMSTHDWLNANVAAHTVISETDIRKKAQTAMIIAERENADDLEKMLTAQRNVLDAALAALMALAQVDQARQLALRAEASIDAAQSNLTRALATLNVQKEGEQNA